MPRLLHPVLLVLLWLAPAMPTHAGGAKVPVESVKTRFRAVLGAVPDGAQFRVHIEGVRFGDRDAKDAVQLDNVPERMTLRPMAPIWYPPDLRGRGRSGGVLLAVLVAPDGNVEKVEAVQSLVHDIPGTLEDATAVRTMKQLQVIALRAARGWKFNVPKSLVALGPELRSVLIRLDFSPEFDVSQAGYWVPVKRGPRRPISWLPPERGEELALAASGPSQPVAVDSPFRLIRPATGTALE